MDLVMQETFVRIIHKTTIYIWNLHFTSVNISKVPQNILHGFSTTFMQPVICHPYIHEAYSRDKIGMSPFSPLQDAAASLVDLESRT